jgi:hypothetical protein
MATHYSLFCSLQAIRTGWVHPNLNLENPEKIVVSSLEIIVFTVDLLSDDIYFIWLVNILNILRPGLLIIDMCT